MTTRSRVGPRAISRALQRDVNRLFEDVRDSREESTRQRDGDAWRPPADITETGDAFEIQVDLPGVHKDHVEITLEDSTLTIAGHRERTREDGTYARAERPTGRFQRSFRLGEQTKTEGIAARHENGVLSIHIPKSQRERKTQIDIQ